MNKGFTPFWWVDVLQGQFVGKTVTWLKNMEIGGAGYRQGCAWTSRTDGIMKYLPIISMLEM